MSDAVKPEFVDIDRHFGEFIGRFGGDPELMSRVAAHLSRATRDGNTCLLLTKTPPLSEEAGVADSFKWPSASEWPSIFADSKAVGGPGDQTPLIVDDSNRLYLRRYWNYEQRLAAVLCEKAASNELSNKTKVGTQEGAVEAAVKNNLTIISGGPGTGKTTTVLYILAHLLQEKGGEHLRVALAAPTGKAAARLEETVRTGLGLVKCPEEVKARMPRSASTIHRLLGFKGNSVYFRHDRHNPLPIDLLIIDEASMVALPLLCKVFDALPGHCRVILLGDRDQLASVEPGAVLADIVDAAGSATSPVNRAVVTLEKNYRFSESSGIHHLCVAVRKGDANGSVRILRQQSYPDLICSESDKPHDLAAKLSKSVLAGYSAFAAEKEPAAALALLGTFRVLTALRRGPMGVEGINRQIEVLLQEAQLIPQRITASYAGKPILITQNDHQMQLYNGDVGVLLPDPATKEKPDQLWAWFIGKENTLRRFAPARLPTHEAAYAMTVHKSQGSEFDRVLFILPDRDAPVLSRELIYTGLTRARSQVELWWNESVFAKAVSRRAERNSGLRDLLDPPVAMTTRRPRQEQLRLFEE